MIAEANVSLGRGVGSNVALVDVVDEVRRRGVDRGRKVRHEGGQQAGDEEAQQAHGHKPAQRIGKHQFKIHVGAHGADVVAEEHGRQHGEPDDEEVARKGEYDVYPRAHHGGFARRLCREHALHIVVRRRACGGDQHALEEQHHDEEAEEAVAVLGDLGAGGGDQR